MNATEAAKILGCSWSNVCWLLRHGNLRGKNVGKEWDVSQDDIDYYLEHKDDFEPQLKDSSIRLRVGQQIGYWTVLIPELPRVSGEEIRKARCRCICGNVRDVSIFDLTHGGSYSCGCRRNERETDSQKEGREKGHKIMRAVQEAGLMSGLNHKLNRNSSTGHTGVSYIAKLGKYRAYINVHRKQIHLGLFDTLQEAVAAREAAEEKYLGEARRQVAAIRKRFEKQ